MPINYTTLLGLAKPVTGTEANAWGDVVNDQITSLVEDAIANAVSISVSAGNVTLSDNDGATDQARMAVLLITGSPGTSRNIVAPSRSKWYIVRNGSDSSVVVKGSATTGVTIASGKTAMVFWNGSDFQTVASNNVSLTTEVTGTLPVANGGTGAASLTANNVILGNGTSAVQVVAPSTNGNVLTSNGTTWASAAKVTVDTIQTTTSGTTKTFTGIPPTAKVIHVMFNRVRITLAQSLIVRVGSASGVVTSSYRAAWSRITNTAAASNSTTSGIDIPIPAMGSSQYVDGFITLCLFDTSNFQWSVSGVVGANVGSNTIMAMISGFTPALPSALDRIEISALGGATFDLGSVNISYF